MEHIVTLLQKQHDKYSKHGSNRKRGGNCLSISPADDGRLLTVLHNPDPDYPMLIETNDFSTEGRDIEQIQVYIDLFAVSMIETLDDIIANTVSLVSKGEHAQTFIDQLSSVETVLGYSPTSDTLVVDSGEEVENSKITYGDDAIEGETFLTVRSYLGGHLLVFRFNYAFDESDQPTHVRRIGFYSGKVNNQEDAIEKIIVILNADNRFSQSALNLKVDWLKTIFDVKPNQ